MKVERLDIYSESRFPRTLEAAFGAYTSKAFEEERPQPTALEAAMNAVAWIIAFSLLAAIVTAAEWWPA